MEISQIMEVNTGLLMANAAFFVGNVLLLWMMFRGVSNAYIYGANTFAKVLHSVMSLCIVGFFFGTYGNITSLINNWAYALVDSGQDLPAGMQMFVDRIGATEYVDPSLIPSDPLGLVFMVAVLIGLLGGMWTAPAPKD